MAIFCRIFGFKSGPDGSGQPSGFICINFHPKQLILDPVRVIFDDLGLNRHCGPDLDLQDQAGHGPLEWVRPVPKAPERSWHASGASFRPKRRFSTHFGQNFMFLRQDRCLLLRQDRCLSSSHLSCLNSRHLSYLNRRHLSCLNRRRDSCRPPAGCCYVFCRDRIDVFCGDRTDVCC